MATNSFLLILGFINQIKLPFFQETETKYVRCLVYSSKHKKT